ncbi:TCR/Tet family MFS transporter [Candidatus Bathyarchaeota archaeon]|nr:MAG: TCR/Tet family MFS transporter [Candidatus Bathyarchaeota archaeon]
MQDQSLMSRRVKPSEQSRLQGANNSIAGLTSVLCPIIFTDVSGLFIGPLASFNLPDVPHPSH